MKVPAKASILFQRTGPFFTKRVKASMLLQRTGPNTFVSPNDFIHYPLTPDFVVFAKIGHPKNYIKRQSVYIIPKKWTKTDKTRKSVYIIPKKWTKRIFPFFRVSQILQKTTKRLYCSKEVDQKCKTRQSVYIIPQKWTNAKFWVIFSRKIDALSGVICPISAYAS